MYERNPLKSESALSNCVMDEKPLKSVYICAIANLATYIIMIGY